MPWCQDWSWGTPHLCASGQHTPAKIFNFTTSIFANTSLLFVDYLNPLVSPIQASLLASGRITLPIPPYSTLPLPTQPHPTCLIFLPLMPLFLPAQAKEIVFPSLTSLPIHGFLHTFLFHPLPTKYS